MPRLPTRNSRFRPLISATAPTKSAMSPANRTIPGTPIPAAPMKSTSSTTNAIATRPGVNRGAAGGVEPGVTMRVIATPRSRPAADARGRKRERSGGAGPRRFVSRTVEHLGDDRRLADLRIAGGSEERHVTGGREVTELLQLPSLLRPGQLAAVPGHELVESLGVVVVPLPQLVRRGHVLEPLVEVRSLLAHAPRPEAVDEHTSPVVRQHGLVDSADGNGHGRTLLQPGGDGGAGMPEGAPRSVSRGARRRPGGFGVSRPWAARRRAAGR